MIVKIVDGPDVIYSAEVVKKLPKGLSFGDNRDNGDEKKPWVRCRGNDILYINYYEYAKKYPNSRFTKYAKAKLTQNYLGKLN